MQYLLSKKDFLKVHEATFLRFPGSWRDLIATSYIWKMFPKVRAIDWWHSRDQTTLQTFYTRGKPHFFEFCEKLRGEPGDNQFYAICAFKRGFFESPRGDFFAISWLVKRSDSHVIHMKHVVQGQGYRLVALTWPGDSSKILYRRKITFFRILWKVKGKPAQKSVPNREFCKTPNASTSRPSVEKSRGDIKKPRGVQGGLYRLSRRSKKN